VSCVGVGMNTKKSNSFDRCVKRDRSGSADFAWLYAEKRSQISATV